MLLALPTPDPAADWPVAQAAAAGDAAAQQDLTQRYQPLVRRWLWFRWGHTPLRGLVDDGVQDVFVECLRPGGAFAHLDPERAAHGFPAFLRSVVQHVAQRVERTEGRNYGHRRRFGQKVLATLPAGSGASPADRRWVRDRIHEAMDRLRAEPVANHGPSLVEFLELHFENALTVREIARLWGESREHLYELRRRALRRFRDTLVRVLAADPRDEAAAQLLGRELLALLE